MGKTVFDDGCQDYLVEGASFVGEAGIPMLMDLKNTQIPLDLLPFRKARTCKNKRQYVHFYMHEKEFSRVITSTSKYLDLLKQYDGVITPDCSMVAGKSRCLEETKTYMNRAVGFYLQKNGVPVIPNIRWGDESSYKHCFLGVPKGSMVCISPYGLLRENKKREIFRNGLDAMIEELNPKIILVHGSMPEDIFGKYKGQIEFHRYKSEFERTHGKD